MTYRAIPLSETDVPAAVHLLLGRYAAERAVNPLLPRHLMGSQQEVESSIRKAVSNGAVGLLSNDRMVGFMAISALFPFKGQRAALIGEVYHGASESEKLKCYQSLYEALGEHLLRHQAQLHILGHFAGDGALQEALFQLGFGAIIAERIRDLALIDGAANVEISQEDDFSAIVDLEVEHMRYYSSAPILLRKDDSLEDVRADLAEHQAQGDALFVYRENGKVTAYFKVGLCRGEGDGRILKNTNSAQLLSAYATPSARGRGIGKALLNKCIDWAQTKGFERLYVEHETANIYGGNFWRKHFNPYLYFSMRYVEDCT